MSRVPKYSVVPGSIFAFVEVRLTEVEDSEVLGVLVFELFTQLDFPHKETESLESLSGFVEFCVTDDQF
jgi:hypothetical protein